MGLQRYKQKRDFSRTQEPRGKTHRTSASNALRFVVQKHDATRLHYDFRLEMEGVLKSWAVPKGFPTRKGDRRLAIQVEDHPIEYGNFEGIIPEGNYGAGTVMVWDQGTYQLTHDHPGQSLQAGKLHFVLKGKKLKGEWALVRMRDHDASKPQWLLFKAGEDAPAFTKAAETTSALSGRSLEEIAGSPKSAEWRSNRSSGSAKSVSQVGRTDRKPGRPSKSPNPEESNLSARPAVPKPMPLAGFPRATPAFVEPMKATLSDKLPKGPEWLYEIKFDGIRALAVKTGRGISLLSRVGNDLTARFRPIATALERLPFNAVLDGEIVALDSEGRSSFQLLQSYHSAAQKPPLFYYVFDALNLEGKDLRNAELTKRKALAQQAISVLSAPVRFSPALAGAPDLIVKEMRARGLEGLVAKRRDSDYVPGVRTSAWVKFKWSNEQEFVIGGYTQPKGARSCFGALLVGYYEGRELLFAGKVGTGFDENSLESLFGLFQSIVRSKCPFANLPEKLPGRYSAGLTASQMRFCTWVEPQLVCQVRYAEWTRDNHLRQPAFLGLRDDKPAREVVRERAGASSI